MNAGEIVFMNTFIDLSELLLFMNLIGYCFINNNIVMIKSISVIIIIIHQNSNIMLTVFNSMLFLKLMIRYTRVAFVVHSKARLIHLFGAK